MAKKIPILGLSYRKLDLHIHTPASHDYQNKKVTENEIVAKSIKMGLDAIAITDHNSGSFIDKIKHAAHKKIVVFPGVEISSAGGKDGSIHVIALLDPSKGEREITMLLALQCQVTNDEFTVRIVRSLYNEVIYNTHVLKTPQQLKQITSLHG